MLLRRALLVVLVAALPAQARFGKGGGSSGSAHPASSSHGAGPVSPGKGSGGTGATASTPSRTTSTGAWRGGYGPGAFVPRYGYGYGYGYPGYGLYAPYAVWPWVGLPPTAPAQAALPPLPLRITAGALAMVYVNGQTGLTLGVQGQVEGERWGLFLAGQNIAARALDGTSTMDFIQQAQLRATYAFLTGRYGRLRAELGVDAVFAPNLIALGPSAALSGTLWVGGPVALEGLVLVTPYPFWQLDYQAGLALGLGPVGLRAGWRTQVLDDRGLVDGTVHRDVYMGPYAGVAVVF
jgi:hypothetical protein